MIRLSRAQSREIDRLCIEDYGLPGIVLMENAARSAVEAMQARYGPLADKRVFVACGPGNNGGDGMAMARLLHNRGAKVSVLLLGDAPPTGDARINYRVIERMRLDIVRQLPNTGVALTFDPIEADLVVDALFGTGLRHPPAGDFAAIIRHMNASGRRIIAIDIPSGLDCDTGEPLGDACIRADLTVTFAAEKLGFANPQSREYTGERVVADIGCPREVIERVCNR